jgi:hypothetical protein
MTHSTNHSLLNHPLVAVVALILTLVSAATVAAEQKYERPPALRSSDVIPEKMQAGDHFKVKQAVHNDGVMNHYVVESDYGQFLAYGDLALARLIHEIHAIAQLDEVS